MTDRKKLGGTVGVTGALICVIGGWAAGADGGTGISTAGDVHRAAAAAVGHTERAGSHVGAAIPIPIGRQSTLKQRRAPNGARRVAQPRRGRGRSGRTVVVRGGRYYSPYYYGLGYGYDYGFPCFGAGYYGYYGGTYSYTGSVRLKVKPRDAEVLVDGYYVGTVDDFDGTFQSLKLEPGPASIEVRAPGFKVLTLDVMVLPGRKITFEENMQAGEPGQATPPSASVLGPGQGLIGGRPGVRDPDAEPAPPAGYDRPPPAFGGVRLRVEPRHAQVFVDGYFVGTVDDFDGGRGLPLESGPQRIEIRADGYESLELGVRILPDETITYEGELTAAPGS